MRFTWRVGALAVMGLVPLAATAQADYPSKPITSEIR
jgi:hypothetical protein